MRSLSLRLLLSLCVLTVAPALLASDVTISGTQTFASLDGSALDQDGVANGVFTVNSGNLIINGVVNCNDDGPGDSACNMAFNVSGNLTINSGGALFAENRTGGGNGGTITLTVGGNLVLNGTAIVSTDSKSSTGANGGAITATVSHAVTLGAGTTIDSGSSNGHAGAITVNAGGAVSVSGNVLAGPSGTVLSTRLTGAALDGGTSNQIGGQIAIASSSFTEPAVVINSGANIISQGDQGGAGPVSVVGCGIEVRGLVAALSRKDSAAQVSIRSGRALLVDGRDLSAGSGTRTGMVRADAPTGTALNKGVDLFARGNVTISGPASGSLYAVTSIPGVHDSKSFGGSVRVISTEGTVTGSGNVALAGHTASGDSGGNISLSAKGNVNLDTAVLNAVGDFNTNNSNRGGGAINVRSYSGNVIWTNGVGEVRPVGSTSGLVPADQGTIVITACGSINTTGTSFPVMGTATSPLPDTHTGVCSPAAPSLPAGVVLITCNNPPVANPASATTNEDNSVTVHLSATDPDGDSITFSIVTPPAHGSLGPVISTGPTTADVQYSPTADYFGSDSFVFRADDGNGGTDDKTATITINPVNDPPSFQAGPTVTVLEDSGAYSAAWATSISAGPANETGQTVTFTVSTSNPALFSVQPAVSSSGVLTFTPAPNANGSASITVTAHDDGGTANGGNDTSAPQSSSITVTAVNDAPSFTSGGDVTVNEDSGAYSAAWATAISAGPANESSQTVHFIVANNNNALFSAQPAVSPSGVLTFTPAANANGTATVTVSLQDDGGTANGGVDTSPSQTFTITVTAVNDAPSFTSGGDVTVLEDSGAYSAAWATAISAGPADESSQTVHFNIVSNSNPSLFSSAPSIAADGTLSFTPAPNAFGDATVTVNLQDNGGTANGGVDTSANVTFTIHVTGVNDAPSFTPGGNVTVDEDSGAYSAAWATAISAGPNEGGQIVHFNVANDNHPLFSVQPSISAAGVLTFTPAPNANGTATVTVNLQDNGGTANGGVDTSATVSFTITVNCVNDPPTAGPDNFSGFGNTELRVDLAANSTPTVVRTTASGKGVLDNDADTVEGDPIAISGVVGCGDTTAPFDCTFASGTLHLNANGSFSFVPAPGVTSATFQYTVSDTPSCGAPASATGTVSLTFSPVIWYVNGSAAPGGNGTSTSPFNSFTSLNGAGGLGDVDGPGDIIFVHNSNVSGSIELEANQHLIGEGVGLTVSGYPLVPAGTKPRIFSGGDAVTVIDAPGTEIAGLELSSGAGSGVNVTSNATSTAGASIHDNLISNALTKGIAVSGGGTGGTTVFVNNTSITSAGNGFDVTGIAGATVVSYTNGTIVSSGGSGIRMDGSAGGTLTVAGLSNVTIDGNTTGDGINIVSATFDATPGGSFNTVSGGAITVGSSGNPVGGAGVVMSNVSGDYAASSITAYPGSGAGISIGGTGLFTGSAGMRVSSGGGAINATAGVALSVTNATIGSGNLNFTSISSTGAANGIVLNNTGTSGGLVVSGTGSAGSGGTIQNVTADSILLSSTHGVSLTNMNVSNSAQSHIDATNVDGLTLIGMNFDLSGDHGILGNTVRNLVIQGGLYDRGGAAAVVANKHGVFITNLLGNSSVSGATFRRSNTIQFRVANTTATNAAPGAPDVLTVSHTTWDQHTGPFAGDHLSVDSGSGGNFRVVTNATGGVNSFTTGGSAVQATSSGSGVMDVSATGLAVTNSTAGVVIGGTGSGTVTFNVFGNKTANGTGFSNTGSLAVSIVNTGSGTVKGTFDDNTITDTPGSNALQTIQEGNGTLVAAITNNVISGNILNNGIRGQARLGSGLLALTITGNNVSSTNAAALQAISLESGASGSGHANTVCLNMANNTASTTSGADGYRLRQRAGTTFNLQNFSGSGTSTTDVANWVNVTKNNTGTVSVLIGTTFSAAPAACATP
jgi:hypothetical protein